MSFLSNIKSSLLGSSIAPITNMSPLVSTYSAVQGFNNNNNPFWSSVNITNPMNIGGTLKDTKGAFNKASNGDLASSISSLLPMFKREND